MSDMRRDNERKELDMKDLICQLNTLKSKLEEA